MLNSQNGTRFEVSNWKTLQLRVTAFTLPNIQVLSENWWSETVGQQPEKRVSQPRAGKVHDEGPLEPGKLSLEIQPARIDWIFGPNEEPDIVANELPNLGPFPESLSIFQRSMNSWLSSGNVPPLLRLALGCVLHFPVPNREDGYRLLNSFLHEVEVDPVRSSDFVFQINKPRESTSGIPGLIVNRLMKWAIATSFVAFLQFTPEPLSSQRTTQASFDCRLELDINNSPEYREPLPNDRLLSLLNEFISLSTEIGSEGDIP